MAICGRKLRSYEEGNGGEKDTEMLKGEGIQVLETEILGTASKI